MSNIGNEGGDIKAGTPWFKCFPDDWLKGTRHLTMEQRGAYMDCLAIMYQTGEPLIDDDKWICCQLILAPRRWRSIRQALIAAGKLIAIDGKLTNKRAAKEIENRAKNSRKLSEVASKREQKKRENDETPNENNKPPNTRVAENCHYIDTESDTDSERVEKPASSVPVAAGGREEISGLNGSTKMIVEQFANWLNPWAPDLKLAHKSIADAVQLYGPNAVRDGFAELTAKQRDGEVRALTTTAFYGFVKRAKERDRSKNNPPPKMSVRDVLAARKAAQEALQ